MSELRPELTPEIGEWEKTKTFHETRQQIHQQLQAEKSVEAEVPKPEQRQFEQLSPEVQTQWNQLVESKLSLNQRVDPKQVDMVREHLQNVAANLHEKFGNLDGEVPETAWLAFDGIVAHIVIKTEDQIRQETGTKYVGSAHPSQEGLVLYPEFFRERGEDEPKIDQAHVLTHELGELAYRFFEKKGMLEQYAGYKLKGEWARDGDYVDSEKDEHKSREEFAETFGDWLISSGNAEMLLSRFERYDDSSQFVTMAQTEEGQKHLDYLLGESMSLRSFLHSAMTDLKPDLLRAVKNRQTGVDELDFGLLDTEFIGLSTEQAARLPRRKPKKDLLTKFWEVLTGKKSQDEG